MFVLVFVPAIKAIAAHAAESGYAAVAVPEDHKLGDSELRVIASAVVEADVVEHALRRLRELRTKWLLAPLHSRPAIPDPISWSALTVTAATWPGVLEGIQTVLAETARRAAEVAENQNRLLEEARAFLADPSIQSAPSIGSLSAFAAGADLVPAVQAEITIRRAVRLRAVYQERIDKLRPELRSEQIVSLARELATIPDLAAWDPNTFGSRLDTAIQDADAAIRTAAEAAKLAEATEWIQASGPELLREYVRLGLPFERDDYLRARLAAEAGEGWYLIPLGAYRMADYGDPISPPKEAIELLDRAKSTIPGAYLRFVKNPRPRDRNDRQFCALATWREGRAIVYGHPHLSHFED